MARIPKCAGCDQPTEEGRTLPNARVVCDDCDDFASGYDRALADHLREREQDKRKIAALEAKVEQLEADKEKVYRTGVEDGKIERARELTTTERKAVERSEQVEHLQGELSVCRTELEGANATIMQLGEAAAKLEQELAASVATVNGIREQLHLERIETDKLKAELLERIAQLEAPRAEVAPVARPPPALIHPELADRARRWASRLGVRLSEYDLDALVREMA